MGEDFTISLLALKDLIICHYDNLYLIKNMLPQSINCVLTTIGTIISRFDLNGVHFNFTLSTQGNRFKSIYGGLFTIITYLIGGLYFGYLLYMWKTYQLQPTITRNSLMAL
jgi:hypothetical protein